MRALPLLVVLAACVTEQEANVLQEILDASFTLEAPTGLGTCDDTPILLGGTIDLRYAGTDLGATVTLGETSFTTGVAIADDGTFAIDLTDRVACPAEGDCSVPVTVVMETSDTVRDATLTTSASTTLALVDDRTAWALDGDGDGYGGADTVLACGDTPPAGATATADDCDDGDGAIHPGAAERCNGVDDDCDTVVDEELSFGQYYPDLDGDGFGDEDADPVASCDGAPGTGFVLDGTDCNDDPATGGATYPGAPEICDGGEDNDCDGLADDLDQADLVGTPTYYVDLDDDGYYDPEGIGACTPPASDHLEAPPTQAQTDCDDGDRTVNPGASEVCDGVDNNCDSFVDDDDPAVDPTTQTTWYSDQDGDGATAELYTVTHACVAPPGYGPQSAVADCDDLDPALNQLDLDGDGATTCDDDCDDTDPALQPDDADGDGWSTCDGDCDDTDPLLQPADADTDGFSTCDGDCDDNAFAVNPGATDDPSNLLDDDCDGFIDCHVDGDGDDFGSTQVREDAAYVGQLCTDVGATTDATDCNDGDPTVYPGAPETVGDAIDDDCDLSLACWTDADDDGHGIAVASTTLFADVGVGCDGTPFLSSSTDDCDDGASSIHPGAAEVPADGIDQSCDDHDACFVDADSDGHGTDAATTVLQGADLLAGESCATTTGVSATADDCDDALATVSPSASEVVADGIDQDCDLFDACYDDGDGDGYGSTVEIAAGALLPTTCTATAGVSATDNDCDDTLSAVNPAGTEIVANGDDEDCDFLDACYVDADGDGFGAAIELAAVAEGASCDTTGFASIDGDCADGDGQSYPGAPELFCDQIVQDCDSSTDSLVQNVSTGLAYTGDPTFQLESAIGAATAAQTVEICGPDLGGSFDAEVAIGRATALTLEGRGATLRPAAGARALEVTGTGTAVTVRDVVFDGVDAAPLALDGALVMVNSSTATLTLDNVELRNGASTGRGGAAAVLAGTLDWASGVCADGSADDDGGCLYVADEALLGAVDFDANAAGDQGGAVFVDNTALLDWAAGTCDGKGPTNAAFGGCLAGAGEMVLHDVTLTSGKAGNGGALYATGPVTWYEGACTDNEATGGYPSSTGGCAYVGIGGLVRLGDGGSFVWTGPDSSGNLADSNGDLAFVIGGGALMIVGGDHTPQAGSQDVQAIGTGSVCWTSSTRFTDLVGYSIASDAASPDFNFDYSCASGVCSPAAGLCASFL